MKFFNLAGAVYDPDVVGVDLPSLGDARVMAAKFASELLRDRPGLAWLGEELRIEVSDSNQLTLFTLIVLGADSAAGSSMERPAASR
jgi:hypothetical protein